ncbi:HD domain protein [Cooperia oncophora]
MYRMAVLAMSLEGQIEGKCMSTILSTMGLGLDVARAVMMSLVHDLAEAIVGDITPHCGISDEEKNDREDKAGHEFIAIQQIASYVPVNAVGDQWVELWREYEAQETLVAKVVKHLDKYDMVVQAFDYERKYGLDLEQFFETTKSAFTIAPFVEWDHELRSRREHFLREASSE